MYVSPVNATVKYQVRDSPCYLWLLSFLSQRVYEHDEVVTSAENDIRVPR